MNTFLQILFDLLNCLSRSYKANVCGHMTRLAGWAVSMDERYPLTIPLTKNGNPDYCLCCIGSMAINCPWCGRPICIGDAVTLYPSKPGKQPNFRNLRFELPDYRLRVGCARIGCLRRSGDIAGYWHTPGQVERIQKVAPAYADIAPA